LAREHPIGLPRPEGWAGPAELAIALKAGGIPPSVTTVRVIHRKPRAAAASSQGSSPTHPLPDQLDFEPRWLHNSPQLGGSPTESCPPALVTSLDGAQHAAGSAQGGLVCITSWRDPSWGLVRGRTGANQGRALTRRRARQRVSSCDCSHGLAIRLSPVCPQTRLPSAVNVLARSRTPAAKHFVFVSL